MSDDRNEPSASRTAETCAFGKCDERLDIPMPSELKNLIAMLASLQGKAPGAYARGVLEMHAILERERLQRLERMLRAGGTVNGNNTPE